MPLDAVLLDLDGTLVDSGPGIFASVRHALTRLGHPEVDEVTLRGFVGPPLHDSFAGLGLDGDLAVAAYREYFAERGIVELNVYPGVPEMIDGLLARGLVLAVATSKPTVYAERILDATSLRKHVAHVCGSGLDGTGRHKRDVVGCALELLGCSSRAALMIGDRVQDVDGAADCGVDTIGALWGYGEPGELNAAWARAGSPREVLEVLDRSVFTTS